MEIVVYFENIENLKKQEIILGDCGISISASMDFTIIIIEGVDKESALDSFKLLWEVLFLCEGYFYQPKKYFENKIEKDISILFSLPYYKSGESWMISKLSFIS